MFKKKENDPGSFWREYEQKTGETVLERSLGRYMSGWDEFDSQGWKNLWGLIIATSGGFRFHHFAQSSWITVLSQFSGAEGPKEKTFFIPKEKIRNVRHIEESKWWKKIFSPSPPQLILIYTDNTGNEGQLLLETDTHGESIAEKLNALGA